ncbi:MAG: hypothetical protein K0R49_544, partial [Burkholderiales bacterium]|nr:hypothetical protein [Burkholderiales bacterium]
ESQDNMPGAREGSVSWTDSSGNLWLFGGNGRGTNSLFEPSQPGKLNDLWKYNISSKKWTWISGESITDQPSIYGEKGIESQDNMPGGRSQSISWIDTSGNLWLFGGNEGEGTELNDLWKYTPSSGKWTWMSGESTVEQYGIYGEKGIESQDNVPGGRYASISWIDKYGNLWLFGGRGYGKFMEDVSYTGQLNDLWKYTPSSGKWTWMSGESTIDQYGIYGEKGIESQNNMPGGRNTSISWIDSYGNLWLFGGVGFGKFIQDVNNEGYMNDLWKYNISSGKWVWISGTDEINQPGIYGIPGVPESSNIAGNRQGSISWFGADGNLWLFGGVTDSYQEMNDLWKYNIP